MITRDSIVAEARTWIGTSFHHQGRLKGVGVDCAGLIIGVGNKLGLTDYHKPPRYGRHPTNRELRDECDAALDRRADYELVPGNIVLIAIEVEAQHLGILTELRGDIGLIHVSAQARKCVEHQLSKDWGLLIDAVYAFPGID